MALPSSGPISIQDIVNEFGGSGSHSLSEYYRGGAFVPDTAANSNIPTSGEISLSDFYGAGGSTPPTYNVLTGFFEDINLIGGGAGWTLSYFSDGNLVLTGTVSGIVFSGRWITGGSPTNEHLRVDVVSGSFTSGAVGSDVALSTSRHYILTVGSQNDQTVVANFTLKSGSGGSTLASGQISLRAGSA